MIVRGPKSTGKFHQYFLASGTTACSVRLGMYDFRSGWTYDVSSCCVDHFCKKCLKNHKPSLDIVLGIPR